MTSTISALASAVMNKTPVPLSPPARTNTIMSTSGGSSPNGQLRAMESDGVLFSVVAKISEALAGVEWRLYRKRPPTGTETRRKEVLRHPALEVWMHPNRHMSRQRLVETFSQHHALVGEAYLVPARITDGGPPVELWPVRPDRMNPVPHPDDFISGYEYAAPSGERVPLGVEDVICIMRPNPNDPYRGLGPVQALMATLDGARYSAEWNRQFFVNGAEPGGVLSVDGSLSDRDFQRLNYQWNEQHKGVSAAHRVAILENGVTWTANSFTRRDMQFAELMEISDDKILRAFGMSKFMIGIIDDVNRASARAAEYVFGRWTLVPALERIKDALNNSFLPLFGAVGENVEFDYVSPVPEDTEAEDNSLATRARAAAELIAAGFYAPEVQESLGLPRMSFGEPGADKERELLIRVLIGAPTLAQVLLPALGIPIDGSPSDSPPGSPTEEEVSGE